MLKALKEELKRLSIDPADNFHGKIKKRVGKRATEVLEKRLKQIILLMPSLVNRIRAHWEEERGNVRIKKLGGFVLAYLYNPKDFLSKDEHGLFGYLDDAYLVVVVYEQVLRDTEHITDEDRDFLELIAKSKKYVKAVIPDETQKIEDMVAGALSDEEYEKFAAAFSGAA